MFMLLRRVLLVFRLSVVSIRLVYVLLFISFLERVSGDIE